MRGNPKEEANRSYKENGAREINDADVILERRRDIATLLTSPLHSESGFWWTECELGGDGVRLYSRENRREFRQIPCPGTLSEIENAISWRIAKPPSYCRDAKSACFVTTAFPVRIELTVTDSRHLRCGHYIVSSLRQFRVILETCVINEPDSNFPAFSVSDGLLPRWAIPIHSS